MATLRQSQKAERQAKIVAAAATLFRECGYEDTSIDAIADRASVSKGTIYNYYQNKGDLLLAAAIMEAKNTHDLGQLIIADANRPPRKAIVDMIDIYVGEPMKLLPKAIWRRAISMSILQPDSFFGQQHAEVNSRLCSQFAELIVTLNDRGHFHGLADPETMGQVLFNNISTGFIQFLTNDEMRLDELKTGLAQQTFVILNACTQSPWQ